MNLIELLKNKKNKILKLQKYEETKADTEPIKIPKIVIENHNSVFTNEEEEIIKGAQILLENKYVESIEEGIIVVATTLRGLKYRGTQKDEDGNTKIILEETVFENTPPKKL